MGRSKPRKVTSVVISENGPPCQRCLKNTEIRQHVKIKPKHLKQPFYYSEWYVCKNPGCKTTLIMPDKKRVFRDKKDEQTAYSIRLIQEQLTPPWNI